MDMEMEVILRNQMWELVSPQAGFKLTNQIHVFIKKTGQGKKNKTKLTLIYKINYNCKDVDRKFLFFD